MTEQDSLLLSLFSTLIDDSSLLPSKTSRVPPTTMLAWATWLVRQYDQHGFLYVFHLPVKMFYAMDWHPACPYQDEFLLIRKRHT